MTYDFSNLSHSDFEDLARDLVGRELGVRFESFPEGPDDGMDGRHATADGAIILQAKHYHRSGFSKLKSKMSKERAAIDRLHPKRYILVTSAPLTPKNKVALAEVIGSSLLGPGDIFGPGDLNALLRKHPDVEKAHQKLWTASTTVLETVVTGAVEKVLDKAHSVTAPSAGSDVSTQNINTERIYSIFSSGHVMLYGRAEETKEVLRLVSRGSPFRGVAIQAIGGMGKTALARECCTAGGIRESYDYILGAQASKRQIRLNPGLSGNRSICFEETGTLLQPRDFLVAVAKQLDIQRPDSRTDADLESEISRRLKGGSALFILDNLETMQNTVDVLALLERLGSPPSRKALITTRHFPDKHPADFAVLLLGAIRDSSACRQIVMGHLGRYTTSIPEDAMEAIIEIAKGHPLALELLSGKFLAEGKGSIVTLRENWRVNINVALNDALLSTLCNYIFDNHFLAYIGETGTALLGVIALEDAGVDKNALRRAATLPDDVFDRVLARLFETGCIRKEFDGELSILTMHPITRVHFRKAMA